jgi:hypothetical protein
MTMKEEVGVHASAARFGTAIAPIITENEVIVAADSLDVDGDLNALGSAEKIRSVGPYYITAWGFHAWDQTGYDLLATAGQAFRQSGVLGEKIGVFTKLVSESLSASVERILKDTPEQFKDHFAGQPAVGAFLFGVEGGRLFLLSLVFHARRRGNAIEIALEQQGYTPAQPAEFMGDMDVMADFHRRYGIPDLLANPCGIAREFVETCIAKDGRRYGPPVRIIRVATNVAEWL